MGSGRQQDKSCNRRSHTALSSSDRTLVAARARVEVPAHTPTDSPVLAPLPFEKMQSWEIWGGQLSGPAFFDLIRNPKLLDVAEQFCLPSASEGAQPSEQCRALASGFGLGRGILRSAPDTHLLDRLGQFAGTERLHVGDSRGPPGRCADSCEPHHWPAVFDDPQGLPFCRSSARVRTAAEGRRAADDQSDASRQL